MSALVNSVDARLRRSIDAPTVRRIGTRIVIGVIATVTTLRAGPAIAEDASSAPSCVASSPDVTAHFGIATTGADVRIDRISLTGLLEAACDGLPVKLRLLGNAAGDPASIAGNVLSTLDSATRPCTGAPLATPDVVVDGSIDLPTCLADTARVHDVTRIIVRIGNDEVALPSDDGTGAECALAGTTCVLGQKVRRTLPVTGGHPSSLAFTGGWITLSVALGLGILILGLVLAMVRRRRAAR